MQIFSINKHFLLSALNWSFQSTDINNNTLQFELKMQPFSP